MMDVIERPAPSPEPSRRGEERPDRWRIRRWWPEGQGVARTYIEGPITEGESSVEVVEAAAYDQLQQELEQTRAERDGWKRTALDATKQRDEQGQRAGLIPHLEAQLQTAQAEAARLRAIGDRLQSEANRMADWVLADQRAPYEIMGAAAGAHSAVDEWTETRAALATPAEEEPR